MVDAEKLATDPSSVTITQSRTCWRVEIGRHRLCVTRVREARTLTPPGGRLQRGRRRGPIWPIAIGTFASVSAFGLFVVGAVASEPPLSQQDTRYSLSVPVPARIKSVVNVSRHRMARVRAPSMVVLPINVSSPVPAFDAADEPYVAKAMRTGDLQEWSGPSGDHRFLTTGPEQVEGKERCRELVLLVRQIDGSNQTRNARSCTINSARQNAESSATVHIEADSSDTSAEQVQWHGLEVSSDSATSIK